MQATATFDPDDCVVCALVVLCPCKRQYKTPRPLGNSKGRSAFGSTKVTYDDYLDLVVQTISRNLESDSHCLTAAALGGLLRQACPGANWKNFGKRNLSELLGDLEHRGRLKLTKTDKDALAVTLCNVMPLQAVATIGKFDPLRKSIWDAFVLVAPEGRRFMHRRTGTVRVALDGVPEPADDWVEICPIGTDIQQEWARAFIAEGHGSGADAAAQTLSDGNWHPQLFVQQLKHSDENIARLWNRFRSAKVSLLVKDWLVHHALPSELAFQTNTQSSGGQGLTAEGSGGRTTVESETENVRRAILLALSTLPLEKLLEIPIPAGVMLSALSNARLR